MSSHYISIECPVDGCQSSGLISTANVDLDDFPNDPWEGHTLYFLCDRHKACKCRACRDVIHSSDCSVHNQPSLQNAECDCVLTAQMV